MVQDFEKIKVRNLTSHYVIYRDEDAHIRIQFQPHQVREIEAGSLRKYFYSHGGQVILQNYLSVQNDELRREFEIEEDQVEYNWDANKIKSVLLEEPIEVLEDALEFGPEGVKEELANQAVKLAIPDNNKREAISNALGINITKKIELSNATKSDADKPAETTPKRRRRVQQSAVEK